MASRQNRVRDQENSKPQDLIVYTDGSVTKDQSGWGFTVKQGATTIHEHSAPYTGSTSSLTMEVEAVTHALRWIATRGDRRTTHTILLRDSVSLLQKVKSGSGKPRLECVDGRHPPSKTNVGVLPWTCWSEGLLLRRSGNLRSTRHYLRAQSQGHHTIDRLEERGVE